MLQTADDRVPAETVAYELHGNLYLNITNRCTLRCRFCPKFNKQWEVGHYDLRLQHEPEVDAVIEQVGDPRRYNQVVFCGLGEPTERLDAVLAISRRLKQGGATIRLNTDGLANLMHGRDVTPELAEVIDEVSISMNAQDPYLYQEHCRPRMHYAYEYMLEFVRKSHRRMQSVTVSAIDGLPGVDIDKCRDIAFAMGVDFRRRFLNQVG